MNKFWMNLEFFSLNRNRRKKLDVQLEILAASLNGKLQKGSFWRGFPKVNFSRSNIPWEVSFFSIGRSPQIYTRLAESGEFCENIHLQVHDRKLLPWLSKSISLYQVKTCDPDFNKIFIVFASKQTLVQDILSAETRSAIRRIHDLQIADSPDLGHLPEQVKWLINIFTAPLGQTFKLTIREKELSLEVRGLVTSQAKIEKLADELLTIHNSCT